VISTRFSCCNNNNNKNNKNKKKKQEGFEFVVFLSLEDLIAKLEAEKHSPATTAAAQQQQQSLALPPSVYM